jgi:formylglycine-generating enzyme required for sulfatase activity
MKVFVSLMLLLVGAVSWGTPPEITSFASDGRLSWQDTNTNGVYAVQWAPTLNVSDWQSDWSSLQQIAATGGTMTVSVPMFYRVVYYPSMLSVGVSNRLVLVAGGGQPQGPQYSFYMGKYEVQTQEYAEFLNNAQAHTGDERGAYMVFTTDGDVLTRTSGTTLFDISESRLTYTPASPVGARYSVYTDYIGHPVTGVSWYGAMKYCNWLTITSGRGVPQRCYHEGTESGDWYPAHLTKAQWDDGFSDAERLVWVTSYSGFRLPMAQQSGTANYYNEFNKAAAWTGAGNARYGFGRSTIDGKDANYQSSGDPYEAFAIRTTPVGYYDGTTHSGTFTTRANANYYGICDLSGNVWEWAADRYNDSNPYGVGGAWDSGTDYLRFDTFYFTNYYATRTGFRIVTTAP